MDYTPQTKASYPPRRKNRKKPTLKIGKCPRCGLPAIRWRGIEQCLKCEGELFKQGVRK